MPTRMLWFATLMLAAMGMTMGAAHVLELPPKMQYDAQTYAAVNMTLYPLFAIVGGAVQALAILASLWLAIRVRAQRIFATTLFGALCLALSLALWFLLVQPVNSEWSTLVHGAPSAIAESYGRLRDRWEYGHAVAFAAWFLGVSVLVYTAVRDRVD